MSDKKKEEHPIVGYVMFPVRVMMLDGDSSGYMHMLIGDCIAEVSDDSGKRIGEVGGAMGASLHMSVGRNTFTVTVRDLWDGFVDFLREHPELARKVDVTELPRFADESDSSAV